MEYTYNGKLWRQSGTVSDKNSFFHSAFGVRTDGDDLYLDKQANFRRMHWATFLTYFETEAMSPPLAESLKRCLSASDKHKSVSAENRIRLKDYVSDIIKSERDVTVEEIPIVAALENIKIVLFVDGAQDPVTIVNPDLKLLGNYPSNNTFKGEVVLSLERNVFSRLDPVDEDSISKLPYIEGIKEDVKQLTAGLIKYKKGGSAGSEGVQFQVGLLTIFFFNALEKLENWMLSTENKVAGKFDDVVLECPEEATLLQAKHKQSKTKKVTFEDLISTNSKNDDFSLPKYFLSYEEIKDTFKLKNVIICTNASVDGKTMKFLKTHKVSPESLLYYQNCDCKFYTFTDDIIPHLRENTSSYFKKNSQSKGINESVITDENIKEFLEHLQLYSSYPPGNDIGKIIDQMLSHMKLSGNPYGQASSLEIHTKILDWFQQKDGVYLTELYAKAVFAEIRRDKHWQRLEKFNVVFQNNDLNFQTSKRMFHITVEGGHLLQEIKVFRALQHDKPKILFVNPDDGSEVQKQVIEAFQLPQYVILILVWPRITRDSVREEASGMLRQILDRYQYKKIVLVADYNNKISRHIGINTDNYKIINKPVKFEDFTQDTRGQLLKKKSVTFQGNDISLEQLLPIQAVENYDNFINSEILEMLLGNEKIKVGVALSGLSDDIAPIYMKRKLKVAVKNTKGESEETTESEVLFSEDEIYDLTEEVVLISDGAGMGKSTLLTSLAVTIKQNHPHLWVVRVDLNNYTKILKQFLQNNKKTITVTELLNSKRSTKLTNHLERSMFTVDGKIVLMLDGFDDIGLDYTQLILNLLRECREAPNFAKIFITTRPHVFQKLELNLHETLFALKPLTRQDQIDFLTKYWAYNLHLDGSIRNKCKLYAKTLMDKVFFWIELLHPGNKHFAAVPLQVRMLAEIFQENNRFGELPEWQPCKEFLTSDEDEPKLPDRVDITRLYQMFIEKKRNIFMDKCNPTGNTAANQALMDQFETCLAYQRTLSLELVVDRQWWPLFSCYRQCHANAAVHQLNIGVVQMLDDEIHFTHRTFAEYFVAQAILQELQTPNNDLKFQELFIERILFDIQFKVVRVFLDSFLKSVLDDLPCQIFETYQSISYEINSTQEKGLNVLHHLAKEGHVSIFRLLLRCTDVLNKILVVVKVENERKFGNVLNMVLARVQREGLDMTGGSRTLLEHAVVYNQLEMVKFLVRSAANVNIGVYKPHHIAVQNNYFDILKYLVENGADITSKGFYNDTTLLYKTVKYNRTAMTVYLLDRTIASSNPNDSLVLYAACSLGRLDIVEALLERGVDIDSKVDFGETALFGAARGAQLDTIRYLWRRGCKMNAGNQSVLPVIHELATAELLIELGVNVNAVSSDGDTALYSATVGNNLDMIKLLVSRGANVDFRNGKGATSLHIAAWRYKGDIVEFLLNSGANTNIKDNYGCAPLHVAVLKDVPSFKPYGSPFRCVKDQLDTIKMLVGKGDINITDDNGCTALHLAALSGQLEVTRLLVELGADMDLRNYEGETALRLATSGAHKDVIELFFAIKCKLRRPYLDELEER